MSGAPQWKVFLRSGRRLEIRKDALRLRSELDFGRWLDYETDGLSNRIRVDEIESVHRLIELPAARPETTREEP
jgi:hypothetical protein